MNERQQKLTQFIPNFGGTLLVVFFLLGCQQEISEVEKFSSQSSESSASEGMVSLTVSLGAESTADRRHLQQSLADSMVIRVSGCVSSNNYLKTISESATLDLYRNDVGCRVSVEQFEFESSIYFVRPGSVFDTEEEGLTPFVNASGEQLLVRVVQQLPDPISGTEQVAFDIVELDAGNGMVLNFPTVRVVATDTQTNEVEAALMSFTFTRSGSTTGNLSVNYNIAGDAILNQDYTKPAGSTIIIPNGASSADLVIRILNDTVMEPSKSIVATVDVAAGYIADTAAAGITLDDDDNGPPTNARMVWLQPSGITLTGNGVSPWNDSSGKSHPATQGSSNRRPKLATAAINGQNAVRFNAGNSQYLTIANHADINSAASYLHRSFAFALKTPDDVTRRQVIWDEGTDARGFGIYIEGGRLYFNTWNTVVSDPEVWAPVNISVPITTGTKYIFRMTFDAVARQIKLYRNGVLVDSAGGIGPIYAHSEVIGIGALSGTSNFPTTSSGSVYFDGTIAEILLYNGPLSQTEFTGIDQYLSQKFAIPIPKALSISANKPSILENAGQSVLVTVTRSLITSEAETFTFGVSGSAVGGSDYAPFTTSVTIQAFENSTTFPIFVTNDTEKEDTETIDITLDPAPGYQIPLPLSINVLDDDTFTPPLAGFVLWLNAEAGVQVDSGNKVGQWNDASGASHNATQSGNRKPLFVANGMGSTPALQFDGSNDYLAIANHADLNSGTYPAKTLAIAFRTPSAVANIRKVIWEQGNTTRGLNVYIDHGYVYANVWNSTTWGPVFTRSPITENTNYYVIMEFDSTSKQVRLNVNGVDATPGFNANVTSLPAHSSGIGLGGINTATKFHDNASSGSTNYFNGLIAEILVFNRILTLSDKDNLKEYLERHLP
ncbi:MAG: LamG-like jellyroll fold domain-containing protein [Oligoflexales bacterium]